MSTEALKRAVKRYEKENIIQINIRLNKKFDTDIIIKLENVPSKMGYIKGLIRQDINDTQ